MQIPVDRVECRLNLKLHYLMSLWSPHWLNASDCLAGMEWRGAWGSRPLHSLIVSSVFITSTPAVCRPIILTGERDAGAHKALCWYLFPVCSILGKWWMWGRGCREGQSEARSGREGIIYIDHRTKIYDYKHWLYSMASNGDDLWKCRK